MNTLSAHLIHALTYSHHNPRTKAKDAIYASHSIHAIRFILLRPGFRWLLFGQGLLHHGFQSNPSMMNRIRFAMAPDVALPDLQLRFKNSGCKSLHLDLSSQAVPRCWGPRKGAVCSGKHFGGDLEKILVVPLLAARWFPAVRSRSRLYRAYHLSPWEVSRRFPPSGHEQRWHSRLGEHL